MQVGSGAALQRGPKCCDIHSTSGETLLPGLWSGRDCSDLSEMMERAPCGPHGR